MKLWGAVHEAQRQDETCVAKEPSLGRYRRVNQSDPVDEVLGASRPTTTSVAGELERHSIRRQAVRPSGARLLALPLLLIALAIAYVSSDGPAQLVICRDSAGTHTRVFY